MRCNSRYEFNACWGLTGDDVDNNVDDDGDGGQKIIIIKYPTLAVICEQLGNW